MASESVISSTKMVGLVCVVQNYPWGKKGKDNSKCALFRQAQDATFVIKDEEYYAELWLSTHPNGASFVRDLVPGLQNCYAPETQLGRTSLDDWINMNVIEEQLTIPSLPFIMKALSIEKPLSLQAHPDRELAQKLHMKFPKIYKDPNHKPELVWTRTETEALCSFRTLSELQRFVEKVAEFRDAIGEPTATNFLELTNETSLVQQKAGLKQIFSAIMKQNPTILSRSMDKLIMRLSSKSATDLETEERVVLRLNECFPNDPGMFAPFYLNYVKLGPGQAMFLDANEPHAYLSGEAVECMACSDNVVRAGLTGKFKDVATLIEMLTYNMGKPTVLSMNQKGHYTSYKSDKYDEFRLDMIQVTSQNPSAQVQVCTRHSVLMVYEGAGTVTIDDLSFSVATGQTFYLAPNTSFSCTVSNNSDSLVVLRCATRDS